MDASFDPLPVGWPIDHAEPEPAEPLENLRGLIEHALANPISSLPLTDLCGAGTRVTVVVAIAGRNLNAFKPLSVAICETIDRPVGVPTRRLVVIPTVAGVRHVGRRPRRRTSPAVGPRVGSAGSGSGETSASAVPFGEFHSGCLEFE